MITRPDDWHVHVRDGQVLPQTVNATAQHFARALIMPNLQPAPTNITALTAYRQRILDAIAPHQAFTPYMTLYLNETVRPDDLLNAAQHPYVLGAKLYPAGATTHSEEGVQSIRALYPQLEIMQAEDLVLQIHGEVTHGDIFDRERLFLEQYLQLIMHDFPTLRIVLEHISTQAAVDFVMAAPKTLAATITPHHLLYHRNQLLEGGLHPHYYCLPILKREQDQIALQHAAVSGSGQFFAGTDSAPHARRHKESACGCAGIYSAPFAIALYAEVFDHLGKLHALNDFMSRFGAEFYHLPVSHDHIELIEQPQIIPQELPFGGDQVVPIAAGTTLQWSIHESS
jgi:dihydroorotase